MSVALVDRLREQYPLMTGAYAHRWHYIEGFVLHAYLDSYRLTGDQRCYAFVKQFVDGLYNGQGDVPLIDISYYNIDQLRPAVALFALYEQEGDPKYKRVLDALYGQLAAYPRTASGSFWHKSNYPHQIWLDGLYMGQPFYVQYIKAFNGTKQYDDTLRQFATAHTRLYDPGKRLLYHACDESRASAWCDPKDGTSPNVWTRSVGWYVMALIDVLELLEGEAADTSGLRSALREAVDGMLPHQGPDGMWRQITDRSDIADNYFESSGTLMLAYALLKGSRLGYLPEAYRAYGRSAFDGTLGRYVQERAGLVCLGGICKGAGLGPHPLTGRNRDGSCDYYINGEPVVENSGIGVAALLLARNELARGGGIA